MRADRLYLAVESSDLVDQGLAAKLYVITEEHHNATIICHLTLIQYATVQDAVIIILNGYVIKFSLNLQNNTHQIISGRPSSTILPLPWFALALWGGRLRNSCGEMKWPPWP